MTNQYNLALEGIIDEAKDAFWAVIAEHHPEVKTGDLSPDVLMPFEHACGVAVEAWIASNRPLGESARKPVPVLDVDLLSLRRYGHDLDARGRQMRRNVFYLLEELQTAGFKLVGVDYGDGPEKLTDTKSVMELLFDLDEATMTVQKDGFSPHGILLCFMNDPGEIVADWIYTEGDPDDFSLTLERLTDDIYDGRLA